VRPILVRVFGRGDPWRRPGRGRNGLAVLVPAAVLLLLPAPPQSHPSRAEYVEAAEAICKAETLAHGHLLAGVEGMIRRGELRRAAPRFSAAAAVLRGAVAKIAPLSRPLADAARLKRWLSFGKRGEALLRQAAADLQAGDRRAVQVLANRLLRETRRANATVAGFDFDYCRVSPARLA
jgi:hypothetical protein